MKILEKKKARKCKLLVNRFRLTKFREKIYSCIEIRSIFYLHFLANNLDFIARPPMLVDKTNFGLVLYNHANIYRFEKISSHWSVKRLSVFLCFSLVNQRRTVTNIENTVQAAHSCNSWFVFIFGADRPCRVNSANQD